MHIRILGSCSGDKALHHPEQLTLDDFRAGPVRVAAREEQLPSLPAVELYTGQQHRPMVVGMETLREAGHSVQLSIVSAGYGLVEERRPLAPYEATFSSMGRRELRAWANQLGIPGDVVAFLAQPADLAVVLLGDPYLRACRLGGEAVLGGPTLFVCGQGGSKLLPDHPLAIPVIHGLSDTRRFRSALVGLKGVLFRLLAQALVDDPSWLARAAEPDLLDALARRL